MYIELFDLFWLTLTAVIVIFWYRGLQVKESALRRAKKYCDELDLQLLDQTIALKGLGIRRAEDGFLKLVRRYQFEFTSTGDERYKGRVTVVGRQIDEINSDAHRLN